MSKQIYLLIIISILISCQQRFTPKPIGYLRFDFDNKSLKKFNVKNQKKLQENNISFSFLTSDYFNMSLQQKEADTWINLEYSKHNATIHLTHTLIKKNLSQLIEDTRSMAYKHTIKADAITEKKYSNNNTLAFGTLYNIEGRTASSVQFYLTDSTKHFLRGSLYFYCPPNQDSLRPVINFIREDIITIMETIQWNNDSI